MNILRSQSKSLLLLLAVLVFLVQILALHQHIEHDPVNHTVSAHVHLFDGSPQASEPHANEVEITQTGLTGKIHLAFDSLLLLFSVLVLVVAYRQAFHPLVAGKHHRRSLYRYQLPLAHAPPL